MTENNTKNDLQEEITASLEEHKAFQEMVLKNKYLHEGEENYEDVVERLSKHIDFTIDEIELLTDMRFIPGGSILSGIGKENVSLSNCYYQPILRDSIENIFDAQKEIARTFSYRGGVGTDISVLRPFNEEVNNASKSSSGAVSFMSSFSELTKTISQMGRRGALLISIDIRHPDLGRFIKCKSNPEKVFQKDIFTNTYPDISSANITVKIPDSFMQAVENDEDWSFVFPDINSDKKKYDDEWNGDFDAWFEGGGEFKTYGSVNARKLLMEIAENTHKSGDPCISFISTVHKHTLSTYIDKSLKSLGFNACSEVPNPDYGNCLLGSFNLPKYVSYKFSDGAWFDFEEFRRDVRSVVRIMNKFSDYNEDLHPLEKQRSMDKFSKKLGIGVTGVADLFAMMGFKYGDDGSKDIIGRILKIKAQEEIKESAELAKEVGHCEALSTQRSREGFITNPFFSAVFEDYDTDDLRELGTDILDFGARNTEFDAIAPAGSISILANNCSSGIEPVFLFSYKRKNRIDNKEYKFIHKYACEWAKEKGFEGSVNELKNELGYIDTSELHWKDRIDVQSICQKYTSNAISSTINCPSETTPQDIYDIYVYAWEKGIKGLSIFRDGCKDGVLSANTPTKQDKPENEKISNESQGILYKKDLLDIENAVRHRVAWKSSKAYLNVSLDDDEMPIEIFCKLPKEAGMNVNGVYDPMMFMERSSNWDLISRLVSMSLRYGISLDEIVCQCDKSSVSMVDMAGILSRVLKKYIPMKEPEVDEETGEVLGDVCPECGESTYIYEGGCGKCLNSECAYSKCG